MCYPSLQITGNQLKLPRKPTVKVTFTRRLNIRISSYIYMEIFKQFADYVVIKLKLQYIGTLQDCFEGHYF